MDAPYKPPLDNANDSARWSEYLERYDRMLALYARQLDQEAESQALLREDLRLRDAAQVAQAKQFEQQQMLGRRALIGLGILLSGGFVLIFVKAIGER